MTEEATPKTYTERDVLEMLHERYGKHRNGLAERYVRAEHVQVGTHGRIADFIAQDRYRESSNGYKNILIGHEVKVSRSDWLTELKNPMKSWAVKRYCDQWYLVVPDRKIVKDGELPDDWGLMVLSKNGSLRVVKKAPTLSPDVDPKNEFMSAFAHAAVRTAYRAPIHRKAPTLTVWPDGTWKSAKKVCQSCGSNAPCGFHQ